jgi:hypothetical protein
VVAAAEQIAGSGININSVITSQPCISQLLEFNDLEPGFRALKLMPSTINLFIGDGKRYSFFVLKFMLKVKNRIFNLGQRKTETL